MQQCCLCDGGNALPVGGLPMAVSTTLRTYSADVSLESRVCTPCLKDIGKNRGFGRSNKDRDCASSNYNCTRQTKKTRRVKSLRPIPECSPDAREVLGIPHYAPSQCICRTCYASLQNASRRSKRAAVSTPVKKKTKMESPSTPDRMSSMKELHESLVVSIISLTSEERAPVLQAMLEHHTKADIVHLFRADNRIRCQLHQILSPRATSSPSALS